MTRARRSAKIGRSPRAPGAGGRYRLDELRPLRHLIAREAHSGKPSPAARLLVALRPHARRHHCVR